MISISNYMTQARVLIASGQGTDGCTVPLIKEYIHKWLSKSKLLCAAHDFGGLGLIEGVRPGIENNIQTWVAHLWNWNPVYWAWGTIVALATLPWVFWRRNLGIKFLGIVEFHIALLLLIALYLLIHYQPYFNQ